MDRETSHSALFDGRDQRGFSLVEAVVGTAIAVFSIIGLAYSFALARGLVGDYGVSRAALGMAQARMETLATLPSTAIVSPSADSVVFVHRGHAVGWETWSVQWVDDTYDGTGGADVTGDSRDYKRVTVVVRWASGRDAHRVTLQRLFPPS